MNPRLFTPSSALLHCAPEEACVVQPLALVEHLFLRHGLGPCDGGLGDSVPALEHALQCAQLAEWSEAGPEMVAAALLHDIGHLLGQDGPQDDRADAHELRAVPLLNRVFGPAVSDPVRLHVAAKRYLVTTSPAYRNLLSVASLRSLAVQGGPMSRDEIRDFCDEPFAADAVALRRWDDLAKTPGKRTPPLAYYLQLLEDLHEDAAPRVSIAATDLS